MMLWPGTSSRAACADAARPCARAAGSGAAKPPCPALPASPLTMAARCRDEVAPDEEVPVEQPATSSPAADIAMAMVRAVARDPVPEASVRILAFMLVGRTCQA